MATGKPRRRHVQQELFQRDAKCKGRQAANTRCSSGRHKVRPTIKATHGLHVVMRVASEVGNLRRPAVYRAIRDASICAAVRERIRILQISIQRTHIHMIVEADDKKLLGLGMQGFQISAAKRINAASTDFEGKPRRGVVFVDRYYLVILTSPTQARRALSYVLNNWRKHAEDRQTDGRALVDRYSSGCSFPDWQELAHTHLMWRLPDDYEPLVVYRPRSWLLSKGWKLAGTISGWDVPSKQA